MHVHLRMDYDLWIVFNERVWAYDLAVGMAQPRLLPVDVALRSEDATIQGYDKNRNKIKGFLL